MNSLFERKLHSLVKPAVLRKYFDEGEKADSFAPDKMASFHEEAIREIVNVAYTRTPFYREKMDRAGIDPGDVKTPADLARLPFTTKDELRGRPWALLACDKADVALVQVSTGTTGGEEIYIMYTWEDFYLHDLAPGYPLLIPVQRGDVVLNALPYEMSSAGLAFHKAFMEGCRATVIPAGKGGAYSTPEKTIRLMRDLRPNVIITTPSWSIRLAEAAAEAGFDLKTLHLKRIWLTGEGCSYAFRERVEKIWGALANFYYGSLECGVIGIECDRHEGYHAALGHVYVEIVDPETGRVLDPGEVGEIVVTCLLRYGSPLLRYRTQDLGYFDPDPCACGSTLPRFYLRGRLVDHLTIQGESFSPFYLEEFLMRLPEVGNWFQFVVPEEGADVLRIRCEPAQGVKQTSALAKRLSSKMEYSLGLPTVLEFVESLPRPGGKTIRVVRK